MELRDLLSRTTTQLKGSLTCRPPTVGGVYGSYRDDPADPEQLAAALAALGAYTGTGDAGEHASEAERLGFGRRASAASSCLPR
jgi:hypothetical protein